MSTPYKVAVIGAGLSGLVTAYELMKLGLRPVVYEADQIGGRLRTAACCPRSVARYGRVDLDRPLVDAALDVGDIAKAELHEVLGRVAAGVAVVAQERERGVLRQAGQAIVRLRLEDLGACAVQIFTNYSGKPLDLPQFEPFFEYMAKSGKPVFLHPSRGANFPDYLTEDRSEYEIFWTFGWPYETSAAMAPRP